MSDILSFASLWFTSAGFLVGGVASWFYLKIEIAKGFAELEVQINASTRESKKVTDWVDREGRKYLAQLHEWHNVKDDDGVYSWYVRKSLEKLIQGIAISVAETTESNKKVVVLMGQISDEIKRNNDLTEEKLRASDGRKG